MSTRLRCSFEPAPAPAGGSIVRLTARQTLGNAAEATAIAARPLFQIADRPKLSAQQAVTFRKKSRLVKDATQRHGH